MEKTILISVKVNCSGIDFSDDFYLAEVVLPEEIPVYRVQNELERADKELRAENEDGECLYDVYGYNLDTLMDRLVKNTCWKWKKVNPEVAFTIN